MNRSVATRCFSSGWPGLAGLLALLVWSGSASAQTSDATRAAARQLANEGVSSFEDGDFAAAAEKLNRAFETLRAPSLGLWSARAFARRGQLVAASERYLEVMRLDPKTGDEAVQRQAQVDASREHDELEPRIPRLTLAITNGSATEAVRVTLDGALLPATLLRAQVPVDPGPHVVVASQGPRQATQSLTVTEGARVTVSLHLAPSADAAPAPRAPARAEPARPSVPVGAVAAPSRGGSKTAVWVALAGAGAGVALGSVTGVMAASQRARVAPECPGAVCGPEHARDVSRINTLRHLSTAGFVIGGVGLAAAGALWLWAPSAPTAQAFVRPRIGLGALAVEGAF